MRLLTCTLLIIAMVPIAHEINAVALNCVPGDTQKQDSNVCFCLEDGLGWTCTPADRSVLALTENKSFNIEPKAKTSTTKCSPGKMFRKYCNWCLCLFNGRSYCTKLHCHPYIWNENGSLNISILNLGKSLPQQPCPVQEYGPAHLTCEPGNMFKHYCNICLCSADGLVGHSTCTSMFCFNEFWNKDGSVKISN